jgi:protease-4
MKQFWITLFGSILGVVIGAVLAGVLLVILAGALIASAVDGARSDAASRMPAGDLVLEIDLRAPRLDQRGRSPFAFAEPLSLTDIVATLERASRDDRVKGLLVRANEFGMAPGQAEEMRAAFARFSESGRFVIAHAQGFEGTGITNYFAVSGADEIWLQDTATFSATGLATETLFLGGLFEQFDAVPEFLQFYEYKNAANTYTERDFTDAHREATLSYLTSIFDTAIAASAESRGMQAAQMENLIVSGPYNAEAALVAGLVDTLGQPAAARMAALERAGDGAGLVEIEQYHRQQTQGPARRTNDPVIAIVGGQGPIVTGSGDAGFGGGEMIGGDHLADAIDEAADSDSVRAIVMRIDSPGGSAIASDQVWDAVVRARQAGKPVVVSMGSVAASGGYYVAAPADLIVANATTITGSIGVLAGKVVIAGTLDRVGVNIEPLAVGGEYVTAYSGQQTWTESQREAYTAMAEGIYADFTGKVAEGRQLSLDQVQEVARGRVWTGAQALELGLVDRIGGLHEAIDAARELAGIEPGQAVSLRTFPRQPTPLEAFQRLFGISAEGAQAAARLGVLMDLPEVAAAIEARREASRPGVRLQAVDPLPR